MTDIRENKTADCGKLRTGILGGSFDPVHNGHIGVARAALDAGLVDRVVFMPAARQPFKLDKTLTDGDMRCDMLQLAFEGDSRMSVSRYELDRPDKVSYTIDTLEHFGDAVFICGADSFIKIHTWMRGDELCRRFPIIVAVRPGYDESAVDEQEAFLRSEYGAVVYRVPNEPVDISSTHIRQMIREGTLADCTEINEKVKEYIIENQCYN